MITPESLPGRVRAIVIGTSAGGVEAMITLLPSFAGARVPVLVVLHLPRDRPSLLVEIFGPRSPLPVKEAFDKEPIEGGTIYFAPADYHLLVDEGPSLALSADTLVHYSRPSIDVLFESAADVYREGLLGIILTGASEDGANGLASVQRAGGVTMVQQPNQAYATLMPTAACRKTAVDFVLPLEQMAALISTLSQRGG